MDEIVRAVTTDGFVKISAVTARAAVERAREIHALSPTASNAALTQASSRAGRRVSRRRKRQNKISSSAVSSQESRWLCTMAAMPSAIGSQSPKRGLSLV